MATPSRSADLLVEKILDDEEILKQVQSDPKVTLPRLAKEAKEAAPRISPPEGKTKDAIWLIVVIAFCLVAVWAAGVLGYGTTHALDSAKTYVTKGETILTVFTTVVGFLAGLLSPSPIARKEGES